MLLTCLRQMTPQLQPYWNKVRCLLQLPGGRCLTRAPSVASSVDGALACIQTCAQPTPSPEIAAYCLEIEAFSCCLRGQSGNIAAVKQFAAAMVTRDEKIESWTGYSTILSILARLLRKVPNLSPPTPPSSSLPLTSSLPQDLQVRRRRERCDHLHPLR
jgi:hypothetical protein